jgi:predicted DNA binding CopG/RHH family protein
MSNGYESQDGWTEWSKYVLKELERLNTEQKAIASKMDAQHLETLERINAINQDITAIKIKASTFGAIAGFCGAALPIAFIILKNML